MYVHVYIGMYVIVVYVHDYLIDCKFCASENECCLIHIEYCKLTRMLLSLVVFLLLSLCPDDSSV